MGAAWAPAWARLAGRLPPDHNRAVSQRARDLLLAGGAAPAGLVALVLAVLGTAAALHAADGALYYRSVQEDGWLEWASFWSFLAAAVAYGAAARRERAAGARLPWFPLGVAAASAVIALEEISWGQRLLGYRPPAYFLAENYQQELNFHNVVATSARQLAVELVLLGYGVALPVVGALPRLGPWLARWGVTAPPLGVAPAFAIAWATYARYPWKHTGEWVELMLGLGLLCSGLAAWRPRPGVRAVAAAAAAIGVLGFATAAATRAAARDDPQRRRAANAEILALGSDFATRDLPLRCGVHKRLYTYVTQYRARALEDGNFRELVGQGLPEERARFFLDPWNSPYWVRMRCGDDGLRVLVYSLGPDRRRDSTRDALAGDDPGTWVEPRRRGARRE